MTAAGARAHRSFHTNGINIHAAIWENAESDAPALVILHGIWDSWQTFAAIAEALSPHMAVYALDLRGHGESDRPARGYDLMDYVADVHGVIHQLPYAAVDVMGHSLGAIVGAAMAAHAPERLRKLVLLDPPFMLPADYEGWRDMVRQVLQLKKEPLEAVTSALMPLHADADREFNEASARSLVTTSDGPFEAFLNGEFTPPEWDAILGRIQIPVLALAGDPEWGAWLAGERLERFRRALPAAEVAVYEETGHHLEAARAERLIGDIECFLNAPGPPRSDGAALV